MTTMTNKELLEHALVGFERQRQEIERRIEEVRRQLNGTVSIPQRKKRRLSPEGRAAIAAAAKKRWARVRGAQKSQR